MGFQEEVVLLRVRRRGTALWLGHLVLALVCAAITWLTSRPMETWILYSSYVVLGAILFFFWLLPAWRYASNFTDITSSRIIQRGGLFARVQQEFAHGAVAGIEHQRGKGIAITMNSGEVISLLKVARPKALAAALHQTLTK